MHLWNQIPTSSEASGLQINAEKFKNKHNHPRPRTRLDREMKGGWNDGRGCIQHTGSWKDPARLSLDTCNF